MACIDIPPFTKLPSISKVVQNVGLFSFCHSIPYFSVLLCEYEIPLSRIFFVLLLLLFFDCGHKYQQTYCTDVARLYCDLQYVRDIPLFPLFSWQQHVYSTQACQSVCLVKSMWSRCLIKKKVVTKIQQIKTSFDLTGLDFTFLLG